MKPRFKARELGWMILPVVLLSGAAWWLSSGGKMPRVGNPLDSGPIRIEYTPFEKVELSPFDVSEGYDWSTQTRVQIMGDEKMPPTFKRISAGADLGTESIRLVYRRGTKWGQISRTNSKRSWLQENVRGDEGIKFKVSLREVPRDAEEVRLRGTLRGSHFWSGAVPSTWKPPKNWKKVARGQSQTTFTSKPFDVQIKGPNEPFPKPVVSRVSPLQFVDAKWIVDNSGQNKFLLQLRRTDNRAWPGAEVIAQNVQVTDEKGKPFYVGSTNFGAPFWMVGHSYTKAPTEVIVPFLSPDDKHFYRHQIHVQGPLHLRVQVSDGECWPLSINVLVPRVNMKTEDFGGAK